MASLIILIASINYSYKIKYTDNANNPQITISEDLKEVNMAENLPIGYTIIMDRITVIADTIHHPFIQVSTRMSG